MKEKKPIKISLSTFFLILAIIVIGVMGYFIYKLNLDNKTITQQVSNLNKQISDNYQQEKNVNNTDFDNISNNKTDINNVDENTSKNSNNNYENYANELIRKRNNMSDKNAPWCIEYCTNDYSIGIISASIDSNGIGYITLSGEMANKYGEKYKVAEKVILCKQVYGHQGGYVEYKFVHEDGTVTSVKILPNNIEISKDTKYKNIVNVISSLAFDKFDIETVYIDIDGNIFD